MKTTKSTTPNLNAFFDTLITLVIYHYLFSLVLFHDNEMASNNHHPGLVFAGSVSALTHTYTPLSF
jgi:hypothetical protein